jgi:hypothetical protein
MLKFRRCYIQGEISMKDMLTRLLLCHQTEARRLSGNTLQVLQQGGFIMDTVSLIVMFVFGAWTTLICLINRRTENRVGGINPAQTLADDMDAQANGTLQSTGFISPFSSSYLQQNDAAPFIYRDRDNF